MKLLCTQPNYLPWLGYFDLLRQADTFVVLDDVQWIKQGRQHRTRLPSPAGAAERFWLSLPVRSKGHREKTFRDMEVEPSRAWARQHGETLRSIYGRAPYFRTQVEPILRPFFENVAKERFLLDITLESLWAFWDFFELRCEVHWSSELGVPGAKTEKLLEICRALGAETYLSALGSTRYLDLSAFRSEGRRVQWQHFRPSFPGEPLRPVDYSLVDWLAQVDRSEILKIGRLHPAPLFLSIDAQT
jgi:hypothetical protein